VHRAIQKWVSRQLPYLRIGAPGLEVVVVVRLRALRRSAGRRQGCQRDCSAGHDQVHSEPVGWCPGRSDRLRVL